MKVNFVATVLRVDTFKTEKRPDPMHNVHLLAEGREFTQVRAQIPTAGKVSGLDSEKLLTECRRVETKRGMVQAQCELREYSGKWYFDLVGVTEVKVG